MVDLYCRLQVGLGLIHPSFGSCKSTSPCCIDWMVTDSLELDKNPMKGELEGIKNKLVTVSGVDNHRPS